MYVNMNISISLYAIYEIFKFKKAKHSIYLKKYIYP
jgi:hypothetical protein